MRFTPQMGKNWLPSHVQLRHQMLIGGYLNDAYLECLLRIQSENHRYAQN